MSLQAGAIGGATVELLAGLLKQLPATVVPRGTLNFKDVGI